MTGQTWNLPQASYDALLKVAKDLENAHIARQRLDKVVRFIGGPIDSELRNLKATWPGVDPLTFTLTEYQALDYAIDVIDGPRPPPKKVEYVYYLHLLDEEHNFYLGVHEDLTYSQALERVFTLAFRGTDT